MTNTFSENMDLALFGHQNMDSTGCKYGTNDLKHLMATK